MTLTRTRSRLGTRHFNAAIQSQISDVRHDPLECEKVPLEKLLLFVILQEFGRSLLKRRANVTFERMRERPEYIDWLPFALSFLLETGDLNREAKHQAEALRAEIATAPR